MPQKSRSVAARYAAQTKSKRANRRTAVAPATTTPRPISVPQAPEEKPALAPRPVAAAPATRTPKYRSTTQIIAGNYDYVKDDLRQIALITTILLGIIVALAFVLH